VTTKADAPGTGQSDVISKPLFARTSDLSFCSISPDMSQAFHLESIGHATGNQGESAAPCGRRGKIGPGLANFKTVVDSF